MPENQQNSPFRPLDPFVPSFPPLPFSPSSIPRDAIAPPSSRSRPPSSALTVCPVQALYPRPLLVCVAIQSRPSSSFPLFRMSPCHGDPKNTLTASPIFVAPEDNKNTE